MKKILLFNGLLVLFATGCNESETVVGAGVVYMNNVEVFEKFEMKKDYDKVMEKELFISASKLDSLEKLITYASAEDSLIALSLKKEYYIERNNYDQNFKALSEKFTLEVKTRLNEYINSYSKEHNYSLVVGSGMGQGNVMYVDDKADITEDLIKYINIKYKQ